VIEQSERFQTELRTEVGQPHRSCLTVLNAEVADSGNYLVVVRNEFGESEVTISLVVTGKWSLAGMEFDVPRIVSIYCGRYRRLEDVRSQHRNTLHCIHFRMHVRHCSLNASGGLGFKW